MPVSAFKAEEEAQVPKLTREEIVSELGQRCHLEETARSVVFRTLDGDFADEGGQRERVLLLCKGKVAATTASSQPASAPATPVKAPPRDDGDGENLDLTGSPLRCSFNLDEDDDLGGGDDCFVGAYKKKSSLIPLPAHEARSLLSRYNCLSANFDEEEDLPACWALVDPSSDGSRPLVWLSSHRQGDTLTQTSVSCAGPYTASQARSAKAKAVSMKTLNNSHLNLVSAAKSASNGEACAVYNLSLMDDDDDVDDEQDGEDSDDAEAHQTLSSSLQIGLQWSRPRHVLEQPSPDARATLRAWVVPGDERVWTRSLWRELRTLRNLCGALEGRGMQWEGRGEGGAALAEELEALMEKVEEMGPRGSNARKAGADADNSRDQDLCKSLNEARNDVDFADLLWGVLCKCESFSELCQGLSAVLRVGQKEEIRPFLQPSSYNTRLGKLVREVIRCPDAAIPEMTGKLPIEILVEIGMEKLRRDYAHSFFSSYLASKEDLRSLLVPASTASASLSNLLRLHLAVELVVLLQMNLSPDQDCLGEVARRALKVELSEQEEVGVWEGKRRMGYRFDVQSAHVLEELAKRQPSVWQCSLRTEDGDGGVVESTAVFSVDPPRHFDAKAFAATTTVSPKQIDESECDNVRSGAPYFHMLKTSIARQISS